MKKMLTGIIIGVLLMSVMPVKAAIEEFILYKADYSLVIQNTEYADEELPLLNYKGNTYAPVRSVFEAAGLNVNWNAEMKQAVVTVPTVPITEPQTTPQAEPTTAPITGGATTGGTTTGEGEPTPTPTPNPTVTPEPTPLGNEAEIAALTAAYNSDITAIETETARLVAIQYDLMNQQIRRDGNTKSSTYYEGNISDIYSLNESKKAARTAQYNADLAALQ